MAIIIKKNSIVIFKTKKIIKNKKNKEFFINIIIKK